MGNAEGWGMRTAMHLCFGSPAGLYHHVAASRALCRAVGAAHNETTHEKETKQKETKRRANDVRPRVLNEFLDSRILLLLDCATQYLMKESPSWPFRSKGAIVGVQMKTIYRYRYSSG